MALTKSATARRLTAAIALAAGALASPAQSQALGQFHQGEAREERLAVNRAIQQCTRMIQQKTAPARVSLLGPCRKPSGEWAGVDRLEPGYRLRFTVTPAGASAGAVVSALQGDAVRVFCTADAQGAVTQFEDVKEGLRESFSSTALCWPAGD